MQPPPRFAPAPPPPLSAPLAATSNPLASALHPPAYPTRPRLKRAHASADTHTRTSTLNDQLADAAAAVVQPAPPPSAPQGQGAAWSAHLRQRSTSSNLDPIKESAAEADPQAHALSPDRASWSTRGGGGGGEGLGLDFGGAPQPPRQEDDGDEPPRRKRIRLAPDHEAFGRLSLAVPSPSSSAAEPAPAFLPHAPTPYPLAPPPLPTTSQPLPSSGAGAFSAAAVPPPHHFASPPPRQRTPSSPLAGEASSLPAAPPTSPVTAAAGVAPPHAASGTGGLATVPWGQSAFFPSAAAAAAVSGATGAGDGMDADEHEVTMLPASGSVDLSPHRIYVASLSPSPPSSPKDDAAPLPFDSPSASSSSSPPQQPKINPLAVRAAALEGLPASLVANLRREADKAQRGELVLYRPPPSLHALGSGGTKEQEARERRAESWREFEVMREREEAVHDAGDDEAEMEQDDAMQGMEDVEMEL
ncbi:hypothetical protein JCM3775_003838 [Rhodotorula graminis]